MGKTEPVGCKPIPEPCEFSPCCDIPLPLAEGYGAGETLLSLKCGVEVAPLPLEKGVEDLPLPLACAGDEASLG